MRATRHNGRSGKHGVYNPKHNDRKFDIANSEHIDAEREKQNIYWDCYRGYVQNPSDETLRNWGPVEPEASFHDIEKMYYEDHYSDFIKGQNARNEKNRHPERNRTTEDLLKNKMTCPEETIFQIGKEGEHISGEQLFHIADFFMKRFEGMFGDHVHIWILHSTWMRPLPISMNVTCLTAKINMGNCVRNRKRHWKHLEFLFPIQISPEEETITGR